MEWTDYQHDEKLFLYWLCIARCNTGCQIQVRVWNPNLEGQCEIVSRSFIIFSSSIFLISLSNLPQSQPPNLNLSPWFPLKNLS